MRSDAIPEQWRPDAPGFWYRDCATGAVRGWFLCDGLPRHVDGGPSPRLPDGWERFSSVRFWFRIDGAEECWRPCGDTLLRSAEHAGAHACALELAETHPGAVGPCPECARIEARAEAADDGPLFEGAGASDGAAE